MSFTFVGGEVAFPQAFLVDPSRVWASNIHNVVLVRGLKQGMCALLVAKITLHLKSQVPLRRVCGIQHECRRISGTVDCLLQLQVLVTVWPGGLPQCMCLTLPLSQTRALLRLLHQLSQAHSMICLSQDGPWQRTGHAVWKRLRALARRSSPPPPPPQPLPRLDWSLRTAWAPRGGAAGRLLRSIASQARRRLLGKGRRTRRTLPVAAPRRLSQGSVVRARHHDGGLS